MTQLQHRRRVRCARRAGVEGPPGDEAEALTDVALGLELGAAQAAREAAAVVFLEGCAYELSVQLNSQ